LIRLSVPGLLEYRDVAVRAVTSGTRLLRPSTLTKPEPATEEEFSTQVISAVSEAFNNLAIHGYERGASPGTIDIEMSSEGDFFTISLTDTGPAFDPEGYAEPPEELPERGMGLFIIRSFMDELSYRAGPPNRLTLKKRWRTA
jgi:serine/threonine-protein kinase RsbW